MEEEEEKEEMISSSLHPNLKRGALPSSILLSFMVAVSVYSY